MSKALFGTHAMPSSLRLADEVRRLRERVAELEAALAAAEAAALPVADEDAASHRTDADAGRRQPATT